MTGSASWVFSPVSDVEALIKSVYDDHPPRRPADLSGMRALMAAMGDPQHRLPFVFHVAGTNGKGSTLAFLQALFEAAGKTVHKYTSPHLVRFEERIVIAGHMVTPDVLQGAVRDVLGVVTRAQLTGKVSFFEIFTASALALFARTPADAVLLETGLGGRLDATNILDRTLSILTRISFDHTRLLGHTLPAIAAEKAGIIKAGAHVVLAPQPDSGVLAVFEERAQAQGAAVHKAPRDWHVAFAPNRFSYRGKNIFEDLPAPALPGQHQMVNAGTAIAALEQSPFAAILTQDVVIRAMRNVRWPARLQRLKDQGRAEIWLDGAHNDSGAETLHAMMSSWHDGKPVYLVTAFKDNKDIGGFYRPLLGCFAKTRVTALPSSIVGAAPGALVSQLQNLGYADVAAATDVFLAIEDCAKSAPQNGARIVIAGSLYLAGEVLKRYDAK